MVKNGWLEIYCQTSSLTKVIMPHTWELSLTVKNGWLETRREMSSLTKVIIYIYLLES